MTDWYTPLSEIHEIVQDVQASARAHTLHPLSYRRQQLYALLALLNENADELCDAVAKDLNKHHMECTVTEIGMAKNDIALSLDHLEEWAAPERVSADLVFKMDAPQVRSQPLGSVLILGAWNYPIQLTLVPLVGVIAAGNCAVIKPSEVSVHTAQLLAELVPRYLDPQCFKVINGAVPETTALLRERFDHICYTGNSHVARIVMRAAAEHLTPVTLELGGKSPCVVDKNANLEVAARRIAWGRFSNAGQTCVAPDYVLCEPSVRDELVEQLAVAIKEFYGDNPQESDSYGRIVNSRHFARVRRLITEDSGKVALGGQVDEADLYIAPTILVDVEEDMPVMREEIFGPVLPIYTLGGIDEAIEFINAREKPLALYVFSNSNSTCEHVIENTTSGGALANDTLMHCVVEQLPFGGVGESGMGAYHGKHSFDRFSHKRALLVKKLNMEFVNSLRYPPYSAKKESILVTVAGKTPTTTTKRALKYAFYAAAVAVTATYVLPQFGINPADYLKFLG